MKKDKLEQKTVTTQIDIDIVKQMQTIYHLFVHNKERHICNRSFEETNTRLTKLANYHLILTNAVHSASNLYVSKPKKTC